MGGMSRNDASKVNFSPGHSNRPTPASLKYGHGVRVAGKRKRVVGIFIFRIPRNSGFSPVRFLQRLGARVARALRFVSLRKKKPSCSCSSSSSNMGRSRSFVAPELDSHRSEAIEDCIEFINSSSSLQRSNSMCSNT